MPSVRRIAVLVSPVDPEAPSMVGALKSAASARRVHLDVVEIQDPARLGGAVRDATKAGVGAFLVLGSPPLYGLSSSLAELTAKHRLPALSAWRAFPGLLPLAFHPNLSQLGRI